MKLRYFMISLFVIGQILFVSCSIATGPLFKEIPIEEHKGKAIVYFYRHSLSGAVATFELKINDGPPLPLPNKGYHLLILDPGTYDFAVSYESNLHVEENLTFLPDTAYYVRFAGDVVGYSPAFFGSVPKIRFSITSVSRDEAMEDLKKCHLIEMPSKP